MFAALVATALASALPQVQAHPQYLGQAQAQGQALSPLPNIRPEARPALWVVNDHDTIIYLFGTFHALDGRADWFNAEVETALRQSDLLVLETLLPKPDPNPASPAPAPPALDLGGDATSQSFLSTGRRVMRAGRSLGMSTRSGADNVLRRVAEHSGKPVAALESFDEQLGMFRRLPASPEPSGPAEAEQMSQSLAALLAYLQQSWKRGETESFTAMLEDMRIRSPDSYRLIFAERNLRWADWIARRLEQPGTVFVAVGAGHLAGIDSVQSTLARRHVRAARIN